MPFTYQAITANCGNDGIGARASATIAAQILTHETDFIVINCQEVDFDKAKRQLEEALGPDSGYTVTLLGKMVTHTKPLTQFHDNTGIGSYIIHKNTLSVVASQPELARRGEHGTSFNKGGMVTDFSVRDLSTLDNVVRLQAVSGHLDSSKISERTADWHKINVAIAKDKVAGWGELVCAMPNIRLSGYDANTRNKLGGEKIWESKDSPQELQALKQAPLGGLHFSRDSTYKTSKSDITIVEDSKRKGYTRGGMLDFVDIAADDQPSSSDIIRKEKEGVMAVGSGKRIDPSTERDHDVIISPLQRYDDSQLSQFTRVKNQMAAQLDACAPQIAFSIRELGDTAESKIVLTEIYNKFLSKEGLLNQQIELQGRTLGCMTKANKLDQAFGRQIEDLLLKKDAWFGELNSDEQSFQSSALDALAACKTRADYSVVFAAIQRRQLDTPEIGTIKDNANKSKLIEIKDQFGHGLNRLKTFVTASSEVSEPRARAGSIIQILSTCREKMSPKQREPIPIKDFAVPAIELLKQTDAQLRRVISLPERQISSPDMRTLQNRQISGIVRHFLATGNHLLTTTMNEKARNLSSEFKDRFRKQMAASKATEEPVSEAETTLKHNNNNSLRLR